MQNTNVDMNRSSISFIWCKIWEPLWITLISRMEEIKYACKYKLEQKILFSMAAVEFAIVSFFIFFIYLILILILWMFCFIWSIGSLWIYFVFMADLLFPCSSYCARHLQCRCYFTLILDCKNRNTLFAAAAAAAAVALTFTPISWNRFFSDLNRLQR